MIQIESLTLQLTSKNQKISELESELKNVCITTVPASISSNIHDQTSVEDTNLTQNLEAVVSVLEKQVNIRYKVAN